MAHRNMTKPCSIYLQNAPCADPYALLASEIVAGAIRDWRSLIKARAWEEEKWSKVNFDELRIFFESDWCEFLVQDFEIEPAKILEVLEKELAEAKLRTLKEKRKRRKRGAEDERL